MKLERHSKIVELIGKYEIETQEELADRLNKAGDQVRERDVSAAAFAHLDGLSVFDHLKHLVQHVLGESLRNVEAEVS